ncbi:MAG: hypothetical protein U1A78_00205 [Polyangia bacterium]
MRCPTFPTEPVSIAEEILTIGKAAPLLKMAERTIHPMAQKFERHWFKVSEQWRFRRQDRGSWMASQVNGPAAPDQLTTKTKPPTRQGGRR